MKSAEAFLKELQNSGSFGENTEDDSAFDDDFLEGFDGAKTAQASLKQVIEARAVSLLAMREHGDKELWQKLSRKFPAKEDLLAKYQLDESSLKALISKVVDHCRQENWLNDERFIEQTVNSLSQKGQGPLKIRQKLTMATSRSDLIEAYLDWDIDDWVCIARDALAKKYGDSHKPEVRNEQAKRMRFLQSRGFSSDVIWKAFK